MGSLKILSGSYKITAGGGAAKGEQAVNGGFNFYDKFFSSADTDKAMVVNCLKKYLPNFHHVETGKNLDQKM